MSGKPAIPNGIRVREIQLPVRLQAVFNPLISFSSVISAGNILIAPASGQDSLLREILVLQRESRKVDVMFVYVSARVVHDRHG